MGEIAEMMLDGTLCQGCGVYLDDESFGVPRYCSECARQNEVAEIDRGARELAAATKVNCPKCGKRVKFAGLKDHDRAVHG